MSTDNECTDILRTEVAELINILMATFASDEIASDDMTIVALGIERYEQQVEQIATTAEIGDWLGLYNICVLYQATLVPLVSHPESLSEQVLMLLESWPSLVMSYLEAPGSPDTSSTLIEHLQDPAWMAPLQTDEAEILKEILATQVSGGSIPADEAFREARTWSEDSFDTAAPMAEATVAENLPITPDELPLEHGFEETDGYETSQTEVEAIDTICGRDDTDDVLASEVEETFEVDSPSEPETLGTLDIEDETQLRITWRKANSMPQPRN